MKALTICNPYAHLIAIGEKFVENRTWFTRYRGVLAIHAAKSKSWLGPNDTTRWPDMSYGGIVATCRLAWCFRIDQVRDIREMHPDLAQRILEHKYTEGPWCWGLADVRRLPLPVPMPGQRGVWDVDPEVANRVVAQVKSLETS